MNTQTLHLPDWLDYDRFQNFQAPVIEEIVGHYSDGKQLVVLDMPTGGGKTVVAESVRQLLSVRGLFVCTTNSLVDQVLRDFPYARTVKGRRHYIPTDAEEDPFGNMPTCEDCDRREDVCTYCSCVDLCPYTCARDDTLDADLGITNTAYFIGECSSPRSKFTGQSFVIADECDRLEEELMRAITVSISPRMQRLLELNSPRHKTVEDSWPEWFEYAIPIIERRRSVLPNRSLPDKRRYAAITRLLANMKKVSGEIGEGNWVYQGYDRNPSRIEFKPVRVDSIATDALWKHSRKWLCMSATVISPEQFVESLGYKGPWACVMAPSTFPKERRPIYYFPSANMTRKTEEDERPKMAQAVKAVVEQYPDQRVLVLPHSYSLTEYLNNHLSGNGRPVFHYMSAAEREQAIADYDATESAVLLAPSLERGFDGIDDRCRVVVMCKVFYPSLGDKQVSKRLYAPGGSLWYATSTARSIVQAAGRGMRHEDDWADVWVLDKQFATFFSKWKAKKVWDETLGRWVDGGHRLFPQWFCEAVVWDGEQRNQLRLSTREEAVV